MNRRWARHLSQCLAVAALLVLPVVAPGQPAAKAADGAAWQPGACPAGQGVTVVMDTGTLGLGSETRCAPGAYGSVLEATKAVGWSYEFRAGFPGMVCQLDGQPDPCNGAPATAYWSLWQAADGAAWSYASVGAGNLAVAADDVVGWAFGPGQAPAVDPAGLGSAGAVGSAAAKPSWAEPGPTALVVAGQAESGRHVLPLVVTAGLVAAVALAGGLVWRRRRRA